MTDISRALDSVPPQIAPQPATNGGPDHPAAQAPVAQIPITPVDLAALGPVLADDHFRQIVEALPVAVYTTDADGKITFFNNAAAAFWGCRPEIGKSEFCGSWKLYWPDGTPLPHDQCPMALALRHKRAIRDVEAIAERPDGSRIPFVPYPTPFFDAAGNLVGGVNMLVDISSRKQNEMAARQLASIVESSDDAIVSKDLSGIIRTWNDGAERLFGYRADEVIGQPVVILIPPERLNEEPGILARIRRGERVDHYETMRRRKDGTLIEISLTVSPVRDESGKIVGASKIARDISDRRRVETNKELLINEMKHRVRNTLATVQALATQTLRSASREDRDAFFARLRTLGGAHDLLTRQDWNRARVDEVVQHALAPFREQHRDRVAAEGNATIFLDANKSLLLTMALHELATNAVKYGALSDAAGRVHVGWETTSGNRLRLRWQESGGPVVKPPERKGFGSQLIERALDGDQGAARFEFAPQGVMCTLEIAL